MDETPLSVVQGETYTMDVTYADNSDPAVPQSLASYRARMSVRRAKKVTAPLLFTLTSDDNGGLLIEPDGRTGVVVVRMSALQTEMLTRTTAYYDLFIINVNDPSDAKRLVAGTMTVDLSVTDVSAAP